MKHLKDFEYFSLNENKEDLPNNIRLGNDYKIIYLATTSGFVSEKIPLKDEEKETIKAKYKIVNKPNSQLYHGILTVYRNGSAIMDVNYTSYSGTKNKYKNYFDLKGNEIIHKGDKTRYEKEYYEKITKK
jgi:hypothetical protein